MQATKLAEAFAVELDKKFSPVHQTVTVIPGRVYDKIVTESKHGHQRNVHAFVARKTGKVIKPAGWNQPQRNSDGTLAERYDISTPVGFHVTVDKADPFGSYLYQR